jgi:hypothetical protein
VRTGVVSEELDTLVTVTVTVSGAAVEVVITLEAVVVVVVAAVASAAAIEAREEIYDDASAELGNDVCGSRL